MKHPFTRYVSRAQLAKMYPEGEQYRVPVRIARNGHWAVDTVYPSSPFAWRESLPSLVDELIEQAQTPEERARGDYLGSVKFDLFGRPYIGWPDDSSHKQTLL